MDKKKYMLYSERLKLAEEYEEWAKKPLEDGSKIKDCALSVITFMQIKGYRKIPEDAVVLTREEYERQQKDNEDFDKFARSISDIRMKNGNKIATFKDLQDYIKLQVKQGSKETAEKFAVMLKGSLDISVEGYSTSEVINEIEDKIEEICKEITEGK